MVNGLANQNVHFFLLRHRLRKQIHPKTRTKIPIDSFP